MARYKRRAGPRWYDPCTTTVMMRGEDNLWHQIKDGDSVNVEGTWLLIDCDGATSYIKSQDFQKNDCTGGDIGTIVPYSKEYVDEAAAIADASNFTTEGQAWANANGSCNPPLPSDAVGIIVCDVYTGGTMNLIGYCDTAGVSTYQVPIYTGNNFLPNDGTPPANCWGLASDLGASTVTWRFEFNVARYINTYPGIGVFVFKVAGRSVGGGDIDGAYSLKGADAGNMTMGGSPGSYMPSVAVADTIALVNYNDRPIDSGADGNYGIGYGSTILTFTYTVSSKLLTLT